MYFPSFEKTLRNWRCITKHKKLYTLLDLRGKKMSVLTTESVISIKNVLDS